MERTRRMCSLSWPILIEINRAAIRFRFALMCLFQKSNLTRHLICYGRWVTWYINVTGLLMCEGSLFTHILVLPIRWSWFSNYLTVGYPLSFVPLFFPLCNRCSKQSLRFILSRNFSCLYRIILSRLLLHFILINIIWLVCLLWQDTLGSLHKNNISAAPKRSSKSGAIGISFSILDFILIVARSKKDML